MTIKIDKELFQWEQNREIFVDFDEDPTQTPICPILQLQNPKMSSNPTRKQQSSHPERTTRTTPSHNSPSLY